MTTERFEDEEYARLAEFRHCLRTFLAFSEQQAKAAGLSPQQHQMLLFVRAAQVPPTIGALAERLVVKHHTAVELVDRLVVGGLVERARGESDRREARVRLTKKGGAVLRRLTEAHSDELRRAGPALANALFDVIAPHDARPRARRG